MICLLFILTEIAQCNLCFSDVLSRLTVSRMTRENFRKHLSTARFGHPSARCLIFGRYFLKVEELCEDTNEHNPMQRSQKIKPTMILYFFFCDYKRATEGTWKRIRKTIGSFHCSPEGKIEAAVSPLKIHKALYAQTCTGAQTQTHGELQGQRSALPRLFIWTGNPIIRSISRTCTHRYNQEWFEGIFF